ncbi:MAG: DUF4142 domain-containing protein, partial [Candidatus Eremiobacteraeota bacterium]|nr:DUF4142 domain-containing protein [Candidatus Eremiobacteraeota bacterium]
MKQSLGITLAAAALVASATGLATSQTMMASPAPGMMATMPAEADFVRAVQQSNDEEIAAARFILRSTKNPAVMAFATQMIDDHSTSDVSLQTASRNAHVPIPQRMRLGMVPPMLQGMMGRQLDAAYMQQQVDAHGMALAVLTTEATSGKSPSLKAFASAQASVVSSHL